ncbi:MAG: hypothetical protein EG823_03530 [Actinobacteria bacterium]|nr:hypothetical protein [Actinomycetota bacterium]
MRSGTLKLIAFAAILAAIAAAACAPKGAEAEMHPAVGAVQHLLELRADDVRDAEAYAPYFADSALATALAESAAGTEKTRRVPEWETPYLSELTPSTASVAVVWKESDGFPDWPAVHVFMLALQDDAWIVEDAVEASAAPEPLDDFEWREE